jgi:hypothetical protein
VRRTIRWRDLAAEAGAHYAPAMAPIEPSAAPLPELFHTIADVGSAEARRLIVELGLERAVRLRNVHYPEVERDLRARSGGQAVTPALWIGGRLIVGDDAVAGALAALAAQGQAG